MSPYSYFNPVKSITYVDACLLIALEIQNTFGNIFYLKLKNHFQYCFYGLSSRSNLKVTQQTILKVYFRVLLTEYIQSMTKAKRKERAFQPSFTC